MITTYIKIEKYQNNKIFYWTKLLNDGTIEPIGNKKVKYKMIYYVSDCSNKTMGMINGYTYDLSGNAIDSFISQYYSYEPVIPKTVGESMHNYACSYINN